jgi:polysaccharide export outer membrane protein
VEFWFRFSCPPGRPLSLAQGPISLGSALALLLCTEGLLPTLGQAQPMLGPANHTLPATAPLPQGLPRAGVPSAALPPQPEEPYTLGAGDRLQMELFQLPQYSGEFEVQVDGSLSLPLVGNVNIRDLTLEQASAAISQRYGQYLRRPGVTLNLLNRRPLVVGIAGEINRPGAYPLSIEGTAFPNLTQLFEVAGGITQSANLREVQIQRQINGRTQVFTTNLWDLINTGNLSQDIVLRDGDSIFIPSTLVSLDEAPILAAARFSPDSSVPITVSVVGEVFRPGPYALQGGATRTGNAGVPGAQVGSSGIPVQVSDAIQIAGGIKPRANIRQVQIRRVTRSGGEQVFSVDLWSLLQTGETRQNAILQDGDTVFIPTATAAISPAEAAVVAAASFAPNTIRVNVVGEVQRSGPVDVAPNTTLNQGILAAGGFNDRARQDAVGLVRLNPDGSVTQREIPVDLAQGMDEANNPALQNNDIIIVGETGVAKFSDGLGIVTGPIADLLFILGAPFRLFDFFN